MNNVEAALNIQNFDRAMRLIRKTNVESLTDEPQGLSEGVPRTFFVNSASTRAASTNTGLEPKVPFATIAQAVGAATASRGDVIMVAAGHTEAPTVPIVVDKIGVSIVGLGNKRNRPAITFGHTGDGISITAASVSIKGLYFPTPSAAVTAFIDIAAADVEIDDCSFDCGANATNGVITIPDAGDRAFIHDCKWRISANGPTMGISIESASTDGVHLKNLVSHGGSMTNTWDTAFISSTVATTDLLVEDVMNDFGPTLILTGAATGLVKNLWPGDVGAGQTQANFGTGSVMVVGGPAEGYLTRRATADIHTAGAVNLFTVTGRVIMTRIIMEVTTVIGAGADTLKLTHTPTGGDAADLCIASASIALKAVGDTFGLPPSLLVGSSYTGALNVTGVATIGYPVVLKAGVLSSTSTNNTTGSTKVDLYWIPEGPGSGVVIA